MLFTPNCLDKVNSCNDIGNENVKAVVNEVKDKRIYSITDKCDLSHYLPLKDILSKDIELISEGGFSMHQLAKYIISLLDAPCNIYASTWATCETVVAGLVNLKQKGLIDNCYFLFDHRVLKYRPNAFALFNQNFNSKVLSIHAKICVIESKNTMIRIVGSGNWTRNDKIEVYSLSANNDVSLFYKNYILNEINLQ